MPNRSPSRAWFSICVMDDPFRPGQPPNQFAAAHLVQDIITNNKLFASNATGMLATGG